MEKLKSWHVGVAGEAMAAGSFARCGCDVSVQYGANQPIYDLMIAKAELVLKVSVKASQTGYWGLTQAKLDKRKANYHTAIERWLSAHDERVALCFVQFKDVGLSDLPRIYLAWPQEVAERLKATACGRGHTVLYEEHAWSAKAVGAGSVERIPEAWKFSPARLEQFLSRS